MNSQLVAQKMSHINPNHEIEQHFIEKDLKHLDKLEELKRIIQSYEMNWEGTKIISYWKDKAKSRRSCYEFAEGA